MRWIRCISANVRNIYHMICFLWSPEFLIRGDKRITQTLKKCSWNAARCISFKKKALNDSAKHIWIMFDPGLTKSSNKRKYARYLISVEHCWYVFGREFVSSIGYEKRCFTNCTITNHHTLDRTHAVSMFPLSKLKDHPIEFDVTRNCGIWHLPHRNASNNNKVECNSVKKSHTHCCSGHSFEATDVFLNKKTRIVYCRNTSS